MFRIYLAGPDVFHPEAVGIGRRKVEICAALGVTGVYPLDNAIPPGPDPRAAAFAIADLNERAMRSCDAVIANLTPFRGPNADDGTAYEVGFMRALGRPVFAYAQIDAPYVCRAKGLDGLIVEDFGLSHNLMLAYAADGGVLTAPVKGPDPFLDLDAFAECAARAVKRLAADKAEAAA